jgi:hypothetical protein
MLGDSYFDVRYDYRRHITHFTTGDAILKMDSNRVILGGAFILGQASSTGW